MEFEWDEDKRRINLRKHGLDFADAHWAFTEDAFIMEMTVKTMVKAVTFCLGCCMNALWLLLSLFEMM